jgi:2-aminoethylphosphonate transport system ATP-binding protein
LKAARKPKAEVAARVGEMLEMVGMTAYARRFPRELSGGQQQRVAIARALAIRPPVLLLDEPLAALDAQLRADMLGELQKLRREVPDIAIVYVTHDQSEALALADRIAVMRDARLVDVAPAAELYAAPPSAFTASFLGGANLLPVEPVEGGVKVAGRVLPGLQAEPGKSLLCIRPHSIRLELDGRGGGALGRVVGVQWRGAFNQVTCSVDGLRDVTVRVDVPADRRVPALGAEVSLVLPVEACSLVPADGC